MPAPLSGRRRSRAGARVHAFRKPGADLPGGRSVVAVRGVGGSTEEAGHSAEGKGHNGCDGSTDGTENVSDCLEHGIPPFRCLDLSAVPRSGSSGSYPRAIRGNQAFVRSFLASGSGECPPPTARRIHRFTDGESAGSCRPLPSPAHNCRSWGNPVLFLRAECGRRKDRRRTGSPPGGGGGRGGPYGRMRRQMIGSDGGPG